MSEAPQIDSGPAVERIRHELKRRRLRVARVERLPPGMVRVVLSGEELRGFNSAGFDDHVKVFFPSGEMRDFTPRRYDAEAGELWLDFFLHDGGPATAWAAAARPGQALEIGGPKGSAVVRTDGIDAHVLIGDETALPAIGRRLEELPATARAIVVVETDHGAIRPTLESAAAIEIVWVARDPLATDAAAAMLDALHALRFPPGRCWFWAATESRAVRSIRRYLHAERGVAKHWIKAAGYWQRGATGAHDRVVDEE
jgi:NADPH-dependent ferric siderophore reductase